MPAMQLTKGMLRIDMGTPVIDCSYLKNMTSVVKYLFSCSLTKNLYFTKGPSTVICCNIILFIVTNKL